MCFASYIFFIKICFIIICLFVYFIIISSQIILSIMLAKYFPFWQPHVAGLKTYSFSYIWCSLHSDQHLSLFHHWFELHFFPSNLHLHLHNICYFDVFNSFIPIIMLNTLRFKSSVLFGMHTLLDKSFRVLQLPTHLSNSTANG